MLSGFFSIFSRYRLSKIPYHLLHGWEGSSLARFQHHVGTFFADSSLQFHIYMPIGFMNTHLTYAALLAFVLPALLLRVLHPILEHPVGAFTKKRNIANMVLLILAAITLVLNNGRSAILGLLLSLTCGMYFFCSLFIGGRRALYFLPVLGVGAVLFIVVLQVSPRVHHRFERIVAALVGQQKHTDYQRRFVWQGTLKLIEENPVIGVGPGQFPDKINAAILEFSQENPRLWYAYAIIQRGHAHNDPFHLLAISGPLGAAAYAAFFVLLLVHVLRPAFRVRTDVWRWGPPGLLLSGLFQCYFQDDEVLLPFWLFVGLIVISTDRRRGPDKA